LSRIEAPVVLDDLFLYRTTRLLSVASSLVIRQCEGRYGITRREWRLIAVLGECGSMLSSELALHAHLQRSRTSAAVTSLVAKKLVERAPRRGDRRLVDLRLTDAGAELHSALMPFVVQLNTELLSALTLEEAHLLDSMLARLQVRAELLAATIEVPKTERRKGRSRSESPD